MTMESTAESQAHRAKWSGKWAFILAAAASAVGLGNLWRFPYLAAKYGGGTFLITYLCLVFTFGISLLLVELALGRKTGLSAIGAFKAFGKKYAFIGVFASLIPFLITPYYCVIGGWVFKYFVAYFVDGPVTVASDGYFTSFMSGNPESFLWLILFTAIVFFVVSRGVKGGIEKANMVMMPTLIVMAIALAVYTLCQPGAAAGAAFYLVPDWSKFSPELIISALGQMFFSLSLAMGIMITYGSYMQKKDSLTSSAIRIGFFDVGVSFLAGLMIIPAAFMALGSGEVVMETSGPGLMFIVLPQMFADFGGIATLVGALFFLLVLFAALTSAISLVETCVSIIQDGSHWHRKKAMGVTFAVIFLVALVVNMGYNGWSFIEPLGPGTSILDFMDFLSNSVMMPVAALMTCIFVGWIIKPKTLEFEIEMSSPFRLRKAWAFMVKFIAPILIVIILVAYVAAQFGLFVM